ncbi:hypothetical protein OPIT5_03950 [Opitutaceae bacterium TAV5]|nr:hypothetical protein OPIT5_03950 [Opitutaceae bacterium TAV5]
MKLSELIQHVGDECIQMQNLEQSLVRVVQKKNDGEITFATSKGKASQLAKCAVLGGKPDHVGLVVWLPREKLPESMR